MNIIKSKSSCIEYGGIIVNSKYFNNNKYYIAVFKSKNYAIKTYYHIERKGNKKFQLISTPCQIQAGCSYSLKFNDIKDYEILKKIEKNVDTYINNIYLIERKGGRKFITLVK